ncbi:MAG: toll/interleukin-1 receptor domain-containing protein [Caulobacterales bacterium]
MADVFISYKREDRETAQLLSSVLSDLGFEVWWDLDLLSGDPFRKAIKAVIDECRVAVVLWSALSVQSDFVVDEASYAKTQGKLCPASIDGAHPPFGFGELHTEDLSTWTGEIFHPEFQKLVRALESRVGRKVRFRDPERTVESQASAAELEEFKIAQVAGNVAALQAYLGAFPHGRFASFVRNQIEGMKADAPARVRRQRPPAKAARPAAAERPAATRRTAPRRKSGAERGKTPTESLRASPPPGPAAITAPANAWPAAAPVPTATPAPPRRKPVAWPWRRAARVAAGATLFIVPPLLLLAYPYIRDAVRHAPAPPPPAPPAFATASSDPPEATNAAKPNEQPATSPPGALYACTLDPSRSFAPLAGSESFKFWLHQVRQCLNNNRYVQYSSGKITTVLLVDKDQRVSWLDLSADKRTLVRGDFQLTPSAYAAARQAGGVLVDSKCSAPAGAGPDPTQLSQAQAAVGGLLAGEPTRRMVWTCAPADSIVAQAASGP